MPEATECLQISLATFRELGDRYGQAQALRNLWDVLHAASRHPEAQAAWKEALALHKVLQIPESDELRARLANLPPGVLPSASER